MIRFNFTINEQRIFIDIPIEVLIYAKKNFTRPLYLWLDGAPLKITINNIIYHRIKLTYINYRLMRDYYPFTALRLKYIPTCPDKYILSLLDATAQTIHSFPLTVDINKS